MATKKNDTISVQDNVKKFDILNYQYNLNEQVTYIKNKMESYEIKLTSLKSKEKIIDDMIRRSNMLVEKYTNESNFKLVSIHSNTILTQFETLSQVQEMLIKYEDMIQKYIKMVVDIENHKINAYTKLTNNKKEDEKNEEGYEKLMSAMHALVQEKAEGHTSDVSHPALLDTVTEQLKLEGY